MTSDQIKGQNVLEEPALLDYSTSNGGGSWGWCGLISAPLIYSWHLRQVKGVGHSYQVKDSRPPVTPALPPVTPPPPPSCHPRPPSTVHSFHPQSSHPPWMRGLWMKAVDCGGRAGALYQHSGRVPTIKSRKQVDVKGNYIRIEPVKQSAHDVAGGLRLCITEQIVI